MKIFRLKMGDLMEYISKKQALIVIYCTSFSVKIRLRYPQKS